MDNLRITHKLCIDTKSPNTKVDDTFFNFILATGSFVYTNVPFLGDYGAYYAVDGQLSHGNSGFFHSDLEGYPWLKIQLKLPDNSDFEPQDTIRVVTY